MTKRKELNKILSLTNNSKHGSIGIALLKQTINKGGRMSKNKKQFKVWAFVALAVAFGLGFGVVGYPNIPVEELLKQVYIALGGGLLIWVAPKLLS